MSRSRTFLRHPTQPVPQRMHRPSSTRRPPPPRGCALAPAVLAFAAAVAATPFAPPFTAPTTVIQIPAAQQPGSALIHANGP